MSELKRIEIIYHHGQLDGLRTCHFSSIPYMTAHVVPRGLLADARKISDITCSGIYFLISENKSEIYVGQTQNGVMRLQDHNAKKEWWSTATLFLAESRYFNLDIISGLEVYALHKAKENGKTTVHNNVDPKYKIKEYDLPTIKKIYSDIEFILSALGLSLSPHDVGNGNRKERDVYHTSRRGINAQGVFGEDKSTFLVLAGSQIDIDIPCGSEVLNAERRRCLETGQIVKNKDGTYTLDRTFEFTSTSAAGQFVLGGSINGWVEWKDKNGKTIDELFRVGKK